MAGSPRRAAGRRLQLPLLCLLLQGATAILFAVFVRYDPDADAALWHWGNRSSSDNEFYFRYPSFQDVHVMVFVGFGFLMAFLQRYGFSSVAFTFLLAAFALQWATLVQGFFHSMHGGRIHVGVQSMINADFCAAAVLISFGAVLGKTGPVQLLLMALLEVLLFGLNEFVLLSVLGVKDAGGSMTIHTFGAYFGLALSRVLYRPQLEKSRHRQGSVYHSDLFAMIGTIFLWTFWPSFNSAPTMPGDGQHRTSLNTYYSLTASTLSTFALSALVGEHGRLDMPGGEGHTDSSLVSCPQPVLEAKFKVQDTCGVHNLHGMPGVLGALLGVLVAGLATHEAYGDGLGSVFPLVAGGRRSATAQAVFQLCGLLVTLTFASVGGGLGGLLLRLPFLGPPPDSQCFEDRIYWEVPGEREEEAQGSLGAEETDTRA
ncbi:ammonium transporter Rh type B isoform X2 [Suricata suricatta]|uniref:ammonium transporter Rh type B isoform X2 n=1 Tax=Suricata suricatta TaxID=37032 RepID=UPI0011552867|nr:ammonium transporter Rh type B isoform X2 [Suricata suricatta]